MTGRGSRMSPEERYLRSVYLNYQVCTDVVRHYFDGLHPPTSLVRYLLDQRTKFEKEEKKIPNYQWIQLYPEVLFRADVHIKETYLASYDRTDLKDYKEFTDRISTIFTCLFDSVDGDQKVKVVNLSRLESGEVLASLEITSQYNPDDKIIQSALEVPVTSGNVDASLETIPDRFIFAKQGDTYSMEIKLTKVNAAALAQKDTKEFRIMAKRLERILLLLFDTVPGTQSVEVEEFRNSTSDCTCATAICKLTSEKHEDEKRLEEAIRIPNSEGRLGKTLKTTCSLHGFSFKEVIVFEAQIKVKENFSTKLENSNSNEFKAFANRVQPIIKGLYNSVTGDQNVEIVKCRKGPSDTVLVLCHIISHGNNNKEKLRNVIEREINTESLSLSHEIHDGFKFESNKCLFEITLKLAEKYSDSTELNNPISEAFKSFKEKVQPKIQRLCDTVCDSPEIDNFRYKSSEKAHSIKFKLTSRGCSDESTIKNRIETKIQTGMLDFSPKVSKSDLAVQKLTDRVFYQVSLNVKRQFTDELKKKHSGEFNAFSKFVQTVLNTHYEKVPGKQEVNVVKCQQGPFGTVSTDVILEIISHGCADEDKLRQPIKDLITFGKLELKLKTNATDFSFKTVRGSKPVSSECFDLSLLITLLRRDSNVTHPKKGYDVLPPKDDISDGAQIATIKHYRNELAHASEAKMDEQMFDDIWSNIENAIKHLGKEDEKFMIAVKDALTMKLDSSSKEMLVRMVQHDRQLLDNEETVTKLYQELEKLTNQANEQSTSTMAEISGIKEEIRQKEEQILENKKDIQILYIDLHRVMKKFDEKFREQDERNVRQDEMNRNMESGIQENRRDIQRLDTQSTVRQLGSHVPSTDQLNTGSGESQLSTENFIKLHFEKLPKELKVGYYDVMILYSSDDRSEAQKFCDHLNRDIYPEQQGKIKAVLYDGPEFQGISLSKFEHFEKGFKRCTFTFLYLTKQFVECDWSKFVAETCLMEAICNPDKKCCFVPVYTEQIADFEIPFWFKTLNEINYYNTDEFYLNCVRRLIDDKIYLRKKKDKIQEEKCFKFLVKKVGEDKANEQRLLNEHENQQQKLEMRSLNSNRE